MYPLYVCLLASVCGPVSLVSVDHPFFPPKSMLLECGPEYARLVRVGSLLGRGSFYFCPIPSILLPAQEAIASYLHIIWAYEDTVLKQSSVPDSFDLNHGIESGPAFPLDFPPCDIIGRGMSLVIVATQTCP